MRSDLWHDFITTLEQHLIPLSDGRMTVCDSLGEYFTNAMVQKDSRRSSMCPRWRTRRRLRYYHADTSVAGFFTTAPISVSRLEETSAPRADR